MIDPVRPIQDLSLADVTAERWHAAHAGHPEYDKQAETCRCGGKVPAPESSSSRRQVGGRSAKFSTAQRQSQENPATAENAPDPDPLLESIASGLPFRAPGPSEFEIRDALNTRLAVVDAELRRLSGAIERLTELAHKKLTAKLPRKRTAPVARRKRRKAKR